MELAGNQRPGISGARFPEGFEPAIQIGAIAELAGSGIVTLCGEGIFPACADSRTEILSSIHRLRYSVFVQELGFRVASADDSSRRLTDAVDRTALHLFAQANGRVVACVRINFGYISPVLESLRLLERFPSLGLEETCLVSRLVVDPLYRRTMVTARLLRTVCRAIRASAVSAVFCSTFIEFVPLYERIGFCPCLGPYADPDFGSHVALVAYPHEIFRDASRGNRAARFIRRQ